MGSLMQELVSRSIHEHLEGINGLVTVTQVELSRDFRWAKIWISIFGGNDQEIINKLQKEIYEIQGEVNQQIKRKIVPRLQFFLDTAPRYAQEISEKLDHLEDDQK